MFYSLGLDAVVVGSVLGLGLGTAIVCFLVYAAFRAVRSDGEPDSVPRLMNNWPSLTRHDIQRPPFNTVRRDVDVIEW